MHQKSTIKFWQRRPNNVTRQGADWRPKQLLSWNSPRLPMSAPFLRADLWQNFPKQETPPISLKEVQCICKIQFIGTILCEEYKGSCKKEPTSSPESFASYHLSRRRSNQQIRTKPTLSGNFFGLIKNISQSNMSSSQSEAKSCTCFLKHALAIVRLNSRFAIALPLLWARSGPKQDSKILCIRI